ncbi:MAG: leucine-rich repeat protein [Lachnospiraceae bacterium]|nr:leucine-rich repeat protein [Lachnospiraceae bacterium]
MLEIPNPNGDAVVIDGKAYSPSVHHNISGTEDTLYAYLTEGRHTVQVGDKVTNYIWDESEEEFRQELTADMFEFAVPGTDEGDEEKEVTYDSQPKSATVTSDKTDGAITVNYYDAEGNKLNSAPTTVGTYKVKIDVAAGEKKGYPNEIGYASATELTADDWMFEITPAPLTVTGATAENKVYDKTNTVKITNVDIVTKFGSDSVEVDVDDLYGELSSSDAGSYTEVTLPDTLKLKEDHISISNYTLIQPTLPVSTNVTISKAAVAPNKPGATLSASNSTETVGAIAIGDLYPGWDWSEADKETPLVSGNSVDATAVYTAEDKANYETVETVVAITRSNCDHEEADEIVVSANTIPGEKEATCTETGIGHTVCEKCGETVRGGVEIPALGHTGGTATCKDLAVCTREGCNTAYGEKDVQNHVGGTEVKNVVEATCTTAGHSGYTECKGCGDTIDPGVTIPALNHKGYTAVEGKKDATCVDTGYTGDTRCQKCGELVAKGTVTAAKGHKWDGGVVTTAPAIGKTGAKKYTCGTCKATKTETIAALSAPASGTVAADDTKAATYQVTKSGATGGEVEYVAPSAKKSSVTIPDTVTIDGVKYNVTSIAKNAFKGNKKLSKVTIGKNVTKIGANAFNGCKKLKTVTIKSEKLKSVGKNAFKGIKSKATIKVPKKKMKAYKKMLKKRGVSSKAKYKKA